MLCSVHFEPSCCERVLNLEEEQQRGYLKKDAVPMIHVVQYSPSPEPSERERRQVKKAHTILNKLMVMCDNFTHVHVH